MDFFKHQIISVDKIIPFAMNSRTHDDAQVTQLAASIREFGFTNPLLIDPDMNVIAGHGRLMAAKKLNMTEVPAVIVTGLDDRKRRALVIADNKLALNAGWDDEILKNELSDLAGDFGELMGFSQDELVAMLQPEQVDGLVDEDEVPEPPPEPVTKIGDIWILGNHRLMCGDSTSIDAVDQLLQNQKADLLFTDPPYGVSYEGGHNAKKRKGIIADTLQGNDLTDLFYESLLTAIASLKDGAALYVWYASGKSIETYASLAKLPLTLRAVIQWYKVKSGLGAFMSQYIPNCEPCMYLHKEGCSPSWYGPTNEKTVWELKKESRNDYHPTQKPVELPERAITNSSKQGDTVLDLFGGSGSTMIAAEKIGRHARLMELDPIYCDVIVKRWENFTGKKATHADTGETFNG